VETAEIHLATNFQNIVFDHPALPADLRRRIYAWLDTNAASERKANDTPEQFYYRARKKAIGPFKREMWSLPEEIRQAIAADLEKDVYVFVLAAQGGRHGGAGAAVRDRRALESGRAFPTVPSGG
jgi:hypothetical protein